MSISSLRIKQFRNLSEVELLPIPSGLNIICGENGSGKTSLLEVIHYLGYGRSFRESTATRLIQHAAEQFFVFSQIVSNDRQVALGVERHTNGTAKLRVADKDTSSMTELAAFLPIRLINSQSHQLFESGPAFRRKYLDWGLFYQSDQFLPCWRQFERALKQRNTILKEKRSKKELDVWTEELVKHGLILDALRNDYVSHLAPLVEELAETLLGIKTLSLSYQSGWPAGEAYATTLATHYQEEYRFGCTQHGPHRADLEIDIIETKAEKETRIPIKHFLSRGQQKLLICAMILAQGKLLKMNVDKHLIYLIDDLPSELDVHSKTKLLSLLAKQQTQIFITAIESESIGEVLSEQAVPMKVFHVKHGQLENLS